MKPRRDPRGSSHEPATTWRASQVPSEAWGPGTPSPLAGQWPEGPELAGGGGGRPPSATSSEAGLFPGGSILSGTRALCRKRSPACGLKEKTSILSPSFSINTLRKWSDWCGSNHTTTRDRGDGELTSWAWGTCPLPMAAPLGSHDQSGAGVETHRAWGEWVGEPGGQTQGTMTCVQGTWCKMYQNPKLKSQETTDVDSQIRCQLTICTRTIPGNLSQAGFRGERGRGGLVTWSCRGRAWACRPAPEAW